MLQVLEKPSYAAVNLIFEPHYMPRFEPKTYSRILGIRDEKDYSVRRLAPDRVLSSGEWLLIDKNQRPDYEYGFQLYKDDYIIGDILYDLRKEGKIIIPEGSTYSDLIAVLSGEAAKTSLKSYKHIPYYSRFGISYDEISNFVIPESARRLEVKEEQIGVPNRLEFYSLGNLYYKKQFLKKPAGPDKWTWEWLEDKAGIDNRELGSTFYPIFSMPSNAKSDRVGFRLAIRFPSKT